MRRAVQQPGGGERRAGRRGDGVERVGRHRGGAEGGEPTAHGSGLEGRGEHVQDGSSFRQTGTQCVDTYVPYVRKYVPYVRTSGCQVRFAVQWLRSDPPAARRCPRTRLAAATPRWASSRRCEQIKRDSEALDRRSIAVGPFARLDAGAVAERDGKTRGVISHLFGNQAAFQAETMERALDAGDWIEQLELPGARRPRRRRRLGRGAVRRRVGARAAARHPAAGRLRGAVGAVAEHRALRPVERAHQRAEHGGARAVGPPARAARSATRSTTSDGGCAMAWRSPTSRARPRA